MYPAARISKALNMEKDWQAYTCMVKRTGLKACLFYKGWDFGTWNLAADKCYIAQPLDIDFGLKRGEKKEHQRSLDIYCPLGTFILSIKKKDFLLVQMNTLLVD